MFGTNRRLQHPSVRLGYDADGDIPTGNKGQ